MPTTANVLQNDDNLSPGITYTFSFKSCNTFFDGSTATILGDIQASAPDFIGSVSVNYSTAFTNLASLWATFLNVTFTYTGDGSDVVSDVANALIACFQSGSNDCFTFQQERVVRRAYPLLTKCKMRQPWRHKPLVVRRAALLAKLLAAYSVIWARRVGLL